MLIEFQVSNYRSFRDRQTFSMVADTYRRHMMDTTSAYRSLTWAAPPPMVRQFASRRGGKRFTLS